MALPIGKSDTMKLIKLSAILVLAVAMSLGATGCKKKPTGVTPLPANSGKVGGSGPYTDNTGATTGGSGSDVNSTGGIPQGDLESFDNMNMDRSAFAANTVHFAYDSSAIRSDDQANVDAVAAALSAESANKVLIEGHCDERGTEGYNMSLGERRALAVREALVAKGVSPDRVRTLSYGEAKPAVVGHDESAWSANRRGEFILLRPKP
jgi:peptidoglycan-associated lipoprotein